MTSITAEQADNLSKAFKSLKATNELIEKLCKMRDRGLLDLRGLNFYHSLGQCDGRFFDLHELKEPLDRSLHRSDCELLLQVIISALYRRQRVLQTIINDNGGELP